MRARRLQSSLDSIIRLLNDQGQSLVQGDDNQQGSQLTTDSWIETWTAPADGKYTLEIRDLHLRGGPAFPYFIELTRAEPHFVLRVDTDKTQLAPGVSSPLFVRVQRKNGFAGQVQLEIEGLPQGVTASCGRILDKGTDGCIVLAAALDAPLGVSNLKIRGAAIHAMPDGSMRNLTCDALAQQEIYMPGGGRSHWPVETHAVAVGAPGDIRAVKLSAQEITMKPGESHKIDITIERSPDFKGNITLDVLYQHLGTVFGNSLPEGVTLDAKNSKTLLTGQETQGHITLIADAKAPAAEKQQIAVMANIAINFVMKATYSGPPVTVTIAP